MQRPHNPRGFTLVELLIVVTVIGIIVAMALGALINAQEAAREQRTRSLIGKLHTQMMFRWESYQSRRIPMRPRDPTESPQQFAFRRLWAQRELMRLELPERYSDIKVPGTPGDPVIRTYLAEMPALSESYLRRYLANTVGSQPSQPTTEFESAECLYMIVTMGHDDSLGTTKYRASDVGDVDKDGMPEFIDGWGRPIRFLRWAPGFLPQSHAVNPATNKEEILYAGHAFNEYPPGLPPVGGRVEAGDALTDLQTGNWKDDHDPFDPLRLDAPGSSMLPSALQNDPWRGYRLMPLIFSSGPDGKTDIVAAQATTTFDYSATAPYSNDPYAKATGTNATPMDRMMGTPFDDDNDGSFDHMDNITNHALGVK